jgi:hypothetical protein
MDANECLSDRVGAAGATPTAASAARIGCTDSRVLRVPAAVKAPASAFAAKIFRRRQFAAAAAITP